MSVLWRYHKIGQVWCALLSQGFEVRVVSPIFVIVMGMVYPP